MTTDEAAESTGKRFSLSTKLLLLVVTALVLVPVIGWFRKERAFAIHNACLHNLAIIEGSKDQASIELGIKEGGVITEEKLSRYIKGGFASLKCGAGGFYTINPRDIVTICSAHGSVNSP